MDKIEAKVNHPPRRFQTFDYEELSSLYHVVAGKAFKLALEGAENKEWAIMKALMLELSDEMATRNAVEQALTMDDPMEEIVRW